MSKQVENITDTFPHPHVTKIHGPPTYETIRATHCELNANAASVQSPLGDGINGLLWLTLSPVQYMAVSGVPFHVPAYPGLCPQVPPLATLAIIAQIKNEYEDTMANWTQYMNTNRALKQQLIGAVEQLFIQDLKHVVTDLANVTTRNILNHL